MFFPLGDSNIEKGYKPIVTYLFIAINIAVFLYEVMLPSNLQTAFVYQYGSIPIEITHGVDMFTLITSMFLHGGWWHLIGNMMFLWVFADNIEATVGSFKFILFYIAGGIIAALSHSILNASSGMPCVGASGSIAACLGAYLVMFPKSRIKVLILIFFTTFRVPAIFFLGFWIVQQLFAGYATLGAATSDTSGVAYWAHIGGFVFGIVAGIMFRSKASAMVLSDQ